MTFEEYNQTQWGACMKAEYKGQIYEIDAANFPEYLVALDDGSGYPMWVRCENINLVDE